MLGQAGRVAIGGRRSSVNDAAHLGIASGDQQLYCAGNIGIVRRDRIDHRTRHGRYCRLVKDNIHAAARRGTGAGIIEVRLDEVHRFQAGEIFTLAGREIIDSSNLFAACDKFGGNRAPDKTGRASYEIFDHSYPIFRRASESLLNLLLIRAPVMDLQPRNLR